MPITWLSKLSSQFRDRGRWASLVLSTLHYLLASRSRHEEKAKRKLIFNIVSLVLITGTMFLAMLHLNTTGLIWIILIALLTITWLARKEITSEQTRAKQAEEALRQERDQLEIRLQERTEQLIKLHTEQTSALLRLAHYGQEFAGYFHDLVNPITTASITLEEISQEQGNNLPTQLKKAEKAMNSVVRFIHSIQKQLQNESAPTNLNISSTINQVVETVQHKLKTSNIKLHTSTAGLSDFYADPIKIFQIISNLINNAADACNQTTVHHEKQIWLSTKTDSESLNLTIRDTGLGIPPEILPRIFEPLTTTKKNSSSLGLGLCIVHHIVTQEYGGLIEVVETGPNGTTFSIYLPRTRSLIT